MTYLSLGIFLVILSGRLEKPQPAERREAFCSAFVCPHAAAIGRQPRTEVVQHSGKRITGDNLSKVQYSVGWVVCKWPRSRPSRVSKPASGMQPSGIRHRCRPVIAPGRRVVCRLLDVSFVLSVVCGRCCGEFGGINTTASLVCYPVLGAVVFAIPQYFDYGTSALI